MKPIEIWQVDSVIGKGEKDGDIRRDSNTPKDSKKRTKAAWTKGWIEFYKVLMAVNVFQIRFLSGSLIMHVVHKKYNHLLFVNLFCHE